MRETSANEEYRGIRMIHRKRLSALKETAP